MSWRRIIGVPFYRGAGCITVARLVLPGKNRAGGAPLGEDDVRERAREGDEFVALNIRSGKFCSNVGTVRSGVNASQPDAQEVVLKNSARTGVW